jgi:hypothetical protein
MGKEHKALDRKPEVKRPLETRRIILKDDFKECVCVDWIYLAQDSQWRTYVIAVMNFSGSLEG